MEESTGKYVAVGDQLKTSSSFSPQMFEQGYSVYEVIRVINSKVLFLEEHMERFSESIRLSGRSEKADLANIPAALANLVSACRIHSGNIKVVVHFPETGAPATYSYFIPHAYPSQYEYEHGIMAQLIRSVRIEPNIKNLSTRIQAVPAGDAELKIYEYLLVDRKGNITEGTKSNVFFISGSDVYTAPDEMVLKGITRQKAITIIKSLNYNLLTIPISINDLKKIDTVFLTGTSPKVLPVCAIGLLTFEVKSHILRQIMQAYDDMIMSVTG